MSLALAMRRRAMRVAASGPLVLVSDSFNRPDSTTSLGTTDTGQTYVQSGTGTLGILANQAYPSVSSGPNDDTRGVVDPGRADSTVQLTLATIGTQQAGILFRFSDDSNYWQFVAAGGQYFLQKRVAGAFTTMAGFPTGVPANGDVIKVVCAGSTITAYRNDVSLGSATDSHNVTATKAGLHVYNTTTVRLEDFKVTAP